MWRGNYPKRCLKRKKNSPSLSSEICANRKKKHLQSRSSYLAENLSLPDTLIKKSGKQCLEISNIGAHDSEFGVLPVAERRIAVRTASPSLQSEDVASLVEGLWGRIWSSGWPEMDVTCRGYVSFVLLECVCVQAWGDKSVCTHSGSDKHICLLE